MRYISLATLLFIILFGALKDGRAATYTVINASDSGSGSLRAAVGAANSTPDNDEIVFDIPNCPDRVCTIILTTGQIHVTAAGSLTILNPAGPRSLVLSGNHASIVFSAYQANLTIDGLTVKDALALGWARAAIISDLSSLVITRSEIIGSVGRGVSATGGSLLILNSTIANNNGDGYGGGVFIGYGTFARFSNCTFSGNTAGMGGAVFLHDRGWVDLINVTITNNSAEIGGGVALYWWDDPAGMSLRNSIISGNSSTEWCSNDICGLGTDMDDRGNNIVGQAALLGPLGDNGGPTRTHPLLPGSSAIDTGSNCVLTAHGCGDGNLALASDQRGYGRVGTVDIGAFEASAHPAAFEIAGQVVNSAGGPVRRARVSLDDGMGNVLFALTNPFGHFRFQGLAAGTYRITVRSKGRGTISRTVTITSSVTDLNMVL